jgi:NAD(P) transhydrogenase
MDDSYDLVVIGAGPAGEVAAEPAVTFGRRVLIVERDRPGGVVTTTGARRPRHCAKPRCI